MISEKNLRNINEIDLKTKHGAHYTFTKISPKFWKMFDNHDYLDEEYTTPMVLSMLNYGDAISIKMSGHKKDIKFATQRTLKAHYSHPKHSHCMMPRLNIRKMF